MGKVNKATANITSAGSIEGTAASALDSDDITEGAANFYGAEANATADQTGAEVRDLVVALADDDREIIITRPTTGQFKVYATQRHSDGKTEVERSDTAES